MTRDEARHYAMGYASGRNSAEEAHGKGCCCKNCPWDGNHGRLAIRTAGGVAAFANAFADTHDTFNQGGSVPPAVDRAWAVWQQTLGQRVS